MMAGSVVQRPELPVPKSAVTLLHVHDRKLISAAFSTAPTNVVAMKKALSVVGLNTGTVVSAVPLMNIDASDGANVTLLLLDPAPNTVATSAAVVCTVTPVGSAAPGTSPAPLLSVPWNAAVGHCATTERNTGAPNSSIAAFTVVDSDCWRLMRKHVVFGLTITPFTAV